MLICILTKNVITSCSVTMMLFLHLEVKPLMTLTTVLYLDRKSGSAGMPRPNAYAVFCFKNKKETSNNNTQTTLLSKSPGNTKSVLTKNNVRERSSRAEES